MDGTNRLTLMVGVALGALFLAAGAGWALHGDAIFVSALMAGLAGCL